MRCKHGGTDNRAGAGHSVRCGKKTATEVASHEKSEGRAREGEVTREMVIACVFVALAAVTVAVLCLLYPNA